MSKQHNKIVTNKNVTKDKIQIANHESGKVKSKNFFLRPIPLYILILVFLPWVSLGFFINKSKNVKTYPTTETNQIKTHDVCSKVIRENDTGLIQPLLLVEGFNEDHELESAKIKINNFIKQKQQEGAITIASVYLYSFNNSPSHIEINPEVLYDPASIMKVPMLLIMLRDAKNNPALLKKKLVYKSNSQRAYSATITDKSITEGKSYTVEELLYYMIVYSDNKAFWLLADNMDNEKFTKLTQEFDIPLNTDTKDHGDKGKNFVANVNSVSRYFRVLYNASYLGRQMSQYALHLLVQSKYKDGLVKGIDPNIRIAHKFGERIEDGVAELHEFGIVYLENNPYLIGVMTKGTDIKRLPEVVSGISKIAFDEMKTK